MGVVVLALCLLDDVPLPPLAALRATITDLIPQVGGYLGGAPGTAGTDPRRGCLRRRPILERLRRQLGDASELYCCSAGNLPHHPVRAHVDEEHKVIFDAAVADLAVSLLSEHVETMVRHLEAIGSDEDAEPSPFDTIAADGPGQGVAAPVR